ncbi:MAG: aliphatic sulfonate ABC transporter substrate-binding protein [Deltaproteobacteria bacterium]|jgi:taurine transport system substrate-binding protein|nr:aliphatic sulfonate ABC transporter substrate-binding protein [Deltaproteobacteria bacterium]
MQLRIVSIIFLGLTLLLAGFAGSQTVLAADKPAVVHFAYINGPRPWILGKADGSYDKALGTKVEWHNFKSGVPVINALTAGEIDIARVGSVPVVSALTRKVPITIIAVSGVLGESEALIAKSSIRTIKDLEGKAVGVPQGTTAHYALLSALKGSNVDISKVRQVQLAPSDMFAPWKRGDIEAAYTWAPYTGQLLENDGHKVISTKDIRKFGTYIFNVFVVRNDFAAKHPELVTAFLKNFQTNVDTLKANPKAAAAIIAKELEQDVAGSEAVLAAIEFPSIKDQLGPTWLGNGGESTAKSSVAKSLLDTAQFLSGQGAVKEADIPASFAPFINPSFLAKAITQ